MKDEESISDSVSDFSVDSDNYDQLLVAFKETHDEANRLALICNKLQKILAMQEELNQFALNEVWTLVPRTPEINIIGTEWVFRNKMDEHGVITRNKARLVAKGYNQEEGIDYDETYAPVARLEAVRLLLAFSFIKGYKLVQMDVKSASLNGYINE
ncbi:uncharacterized mitochondrial protein AtMg00820-like [Phaseolus vulgaris]|uniref:uncharacterized mitochondrial protein AtMg00820-like n=1 Tax=Phaseolus vulgaris TaxID=3885 RepID=UPI0035CC2032